MIWQFKINGTEVEEPIGWDKLVINITRSTEYWGLENVYSDNITFWDEGAAIIRDSYELSGIDAELDFEANYDCGEGFVNFVSGILNCFSYQIINNVVTVKIEPSGFQRDVKNNIDTPINLLSTTSIDGSEMSAFVQRDLHLHSKAIVQQGLMKLNNTLSDQSVTSVDDSSFNAIYAPMQIASDEYGTLNEVTTIFDIQPAIGPYNPQRLFTAPVSGDYTFTYDIDLTIFETAAGFRSFDMEMDFSINNAAVHSVTPISSHAQNGGTISVIQKGAGTFTIHINAGDFISLYTSLFNSTPPRSADIRQLIRTATFGVRSNVVYAPTITKAFHIHEVFAILAESMTGIKDSFRSDYFGKTDSFPHEYLADGCASWTAITNGLAIRNMLNIDGNQYNIQADFKSFYESVDAIYNIGMRIKKEGDKEYLRIEPKEYFFNASQVLGFFNVSDLKKRPAVEYIFNTYQNGYDKWNLNITGSNALDEFNSQHSYTLPSRMSNTALQKISKLIASGYLIEQTRRIQFMNNPTNDFETDNDLFIICTNRTEVISDKYSTPSVSQAYAAGTVSERDENFTSITNVLNPDSNYNYRISPTRIAANWYSFYSGTLFKNTSLPVKFVSGQGNYIESDRMTGDCIVIDAVRQNQNILKSDLNGSAAIAIFNPEILEFTSPISFDSFVHIIANTEKAIGVSCSSQGNYIGFIMSAKPGLNSDGPMTEFTLLAGSCRPGDFNNDFNNDFFLGNCN